MTDPASHEALEQLLSELERTGDRGVADTARRAIHAVLEIHRDALAQFLKLVERHPDLQAEALREPAIAALLLLHGLHPDSLATRVTRAADQVRATGAILEVLQADTDAVRVRTAHDVTRALEHALLEHAPDAGPLIIDRPASSDVIPVERLTRRIDTCELCGAPIPELHAHQDRGERSVLCVCDRCAHTGDAPGLHLHARPIDLPVLSDTLWPRLGIPVDLAFIVARGAAGVALYPGPAGLTEATIDDAAWRDLSRHITLAPDGEALLCDRLSSPPRTYRASLAACYAVAGLFRRHWSTGRRAAWSHVRGFLAGLTGEAA